jgi:hypothetical protein
LQEIGCNDQDIAGSDESFFHGWGGIKKVGVDAPTLI